MTHPIEAEYDDGFLNYTISARWHDRVLDVDVDDDGVPESLLEVELTEVFVRDDTSLDLKLDLDTLAPDLAKKLVDVATQALHDMIESEAERKAEGL